MKREDIELYAFLFFCGKEERELLLGKKKATYEEFSRLAYLADFLGLPALLQKLWEMFGEGFYEETDRRAGNLISRTEKMDLEEETDILILEKMRQQERWLLDFCSHAQSWKKRLLKQTVEEICREKGICLEEAAEKF